MSCTPRTELELNIDLPFYPSMCQSLPCDYFLKIDSNKGLQTNSCGQEKIRILIAALWVIANISTLNVHQKNDYTV